jgi:benzoyl-CoA 2,3-epoxidase subunit A
MQTDTGQRTPFRQHLIDPETCIRCNTCESRCPTKAISHERNYVVDPERYNHCLRCVRPCPTGAVDHWFIVARPYSL